MRVSHNISASVRFFCVFCCACKNKILVGNKNDWQISLGALYCLERPSWHSLRGRRLKGKGKGVLGARETRGGRLVLTKKPRSGIQLPKRAYVTRCKSRNPVKYVQNFLLQVRFEIKNEPKTWHWSGHEKTKERKKKEKLQIRKKLSQSWEGDKTLCCLFLP